MLEDKLTELSIWKRDTDDERGKMSEDHTMVNERTDFWSPNF